LGLARAWPARRRSPVASLSPRRSEHRRAAALTAALGRTRPRSVALAPARRQALRPASRSVVRLGLVARHRRRSAIDSMGTQAIEESLLSAERPPLVELVDVVKTFGAKAALAGVSWSVPAGQICGLLGPNGAGKTTLFRLLMGILQAT